MTEYWDCIRFVKTKNDKTKAVRLGSAKKRDDGGWSVYLDALPPDGQFAIVPQRESKERAYAKSNVADQDAPF